MRRPKLSIDSQIRHMEKKGIEFNIVSKAEAKDFLENHTYYFKIKSYAKNYGKITTSDEQEKYVNLEFAYMLELSRIDAQLRYLIVHLCLDIEHFLKVRLLKDFNKSSNNGYNLVERLFIINSASKDAIARKGRKSTCMDLVNKYKNDFAIWNIVEVMTFGEFLKFLLLYYGDSYLSYYGLLESVRCLRNAAAHNNCLLNSLAIPYTYRGKFNPARRVQTYVQSLKRGGRYSIGERMIKTKLNNPIIHDFIALLLVYNDVVPDSETKHMRVQAVNELFKNRMLRNKEYFKGNDAITTSYSFVTKIIDNLL